MLRSLTRKFFNGASRTKYERLRKARMIASDMDGTLLNREERVAPTTAQLIHEITGIDIPFVVITRRHYLAAKTHLEGLAPDSPIISLDGAMISFAGERPHKLISFDHDFALDILDEIGQNPGVEYCAITPDCHIVSAMDIVIPSHYEHSNIHRYLIEDIHEIDRNIVEIVASGDFYSVNTVYNYIETKMRKGELKLSLYESRSKKDHWFLEVTSASATKHNALEHLVSDLGYTMKEVIGIGDHVNDIEFCRNAGYSVAMQNAVSELKKNADFVTTKDFTLSGIDEFLEYFLTVRDVDIERKGMERKHVRRERSR